MPRSSRPARRPASARWLARRACVALLGCATIAGCRTGGTAAAAPSSLSEVRAWCIQLSGFDQPLALARLVAAEVDLVVVDPGALPSEAEARATFLQRLKQSPGAASRAKLVFAYLDGAELERSLASTGPASEAPWRASPFDGFYVAGATPSALEALRSSAPGRPVIAALDAGAAASSALLSGPLAGVALEGPSYAAQRAAPWGDERGGGEARDEGGRDAALAALSALRARGLTTFTLDFAVNSAQRARATRASRAAGALPYVSRAPLDRLPDHVFDRSEVF